MLNAAVHLVFNMRLSRNQCHMLPCLKKFHFLLIKYQINFKIAMLTFKCLLGFSPQYLQDLVARKIPSDKYNIRDNEDVLLLEKMCKCQTVKAECMFSYSSSQVRNALSYHFALEKVIFKCKLKCHYVELAFCDVYTACLRCVFFSCDNCYCNDLVVYCVRLSYDLSLSQVIDNKVDSLLRD